MLAQGAGPRAGMMGGAGGIADLMNPMGPGRPLVPGWLKLATTCLCV